jgi:hypothetical protein
MRSILLGTAILAALAGPALAQPNGGFGGRPGPGGFGGRTGMGPRGPGRMRQRFERANITHDGHLTLEQARDANMPVIMRHFNQIDAGHKGYITLDDLRAYRAKVAAQRRAAQGEPDPVGPDGPAGRGGAPQDDGEGPEQ